MPRKECHINGCRCAAGLKQVNAKDESLSSALLSASGVHDGRWLKPPTTNYSSSTRTYLCELQRALSQGGLNYSLKSAPQPASTRPAASTPASPTAAQWLPPSSARKPRRAKRSWVRRSLE